ncbi:MAG: DUF305 domain-containing protein [Chloroflexota bacterium]|nr:DUF305 domain-containing protein [Chloroflexota bacterium]
MRTRNPRRSWLIAIPTLLIIALALAACGGSKATATPATSGAATNAAMPFDQQFIDMMAPHHMGAVAMAQIALTRAEHPELKTLANSIIASQNSEIGQMKQWRTAWYGSDQTPPMDQMATLPGMDMNMMNGMTMSHDIQNLQTAMPFDKAFLMAMIPHHQSAIAGAKLEQEKGMHPELKQLAGTIIADQQKEINQMQNWLKTWYP